VARSARSTPGVAVRDTKKQTGISVIWYLKNTSRKNAGI
jgi:hypothetical protein